MDLTKSPQPGDFSLAQTATLCRLVERTVRSMPRPAKWSAHLGDSQATGAVAVVRAELLTLLIGDKILVVLVWQPKP